MGGWGAFHSDPNPCIDKLPPEARAEDRVYVLVVSPLIGLSAKSSIPVKQRRLTIWVSFSEWREIARIRDNGVGIGDGWFEEHISRQVGGGSDTFFWTDPWVDESSLRERFGRLFDLAETQSCTVAERVGGGDVGGVLDLTS
ncbi:hypothetical protein TSUD_23010 [Trifolium subterraneum]|uniref:Reverse transcriptase zinc-binding domain-containing protein n=1 Tax=Trifolium subterraneum TaxID=3900 RepID=A0A2Z6NRQ7_TRISU|nr:hypothetical protein TSUD_23010 [Trifolium subterraneum]